MPAKDMAGQRFGLLVVVNRVPLKGKNARWNCTCDCGSTTTVYGYHLRNGTIASCGCRRGFGGGVAATHSGTYSYKTAHALVVRRKGAAKNHRCVDCGGVAYDWSLRHDALETHLGNTGHGVLCRYSANPLDYEARCRTCHRRYDRP